MIAIEDGVPVVAGRRFPWVKKVWGPNEVGATSFDLMFENGWNAKVYFFPGGDTCGIQGWSHRGDSYWDDEWFDKEFTAEECLAELDRIASAATD